MGILGDATVVSAQTGRKLNNALTVTFKTSPDRRLATAVQAGSIGVLLGFRNGGGGHYKFSGGGRELTVECASPRSQLTSGDGQVVGTIEKDESAAGVVGPPTARSWCGRRPSRRTRKPISCGSIR
jgi:hypothetical protein